MPRPVACSGASGANTLLCISRLKRYRSGTRRSLRLRRLDSRYAAVLDNATLAAAEIGPVLSPAQITGALMGLLIAGGMLIPGNIPNIIAACKLEITSSEWARVGVPLGLILMAGFFAIIFIPAFFGL